MKKYLVQTTDFRNNKADVIFETIGQAEGYAATMRLKNYTAIVKPYDEPAHVNEKPLFTRLKGQSAMDKDPICPISPLSDRFPGMSKGVK